MKPMLNEVLIVVELLIRKMRVQSESLTSRYVKWGGLIIYEQLFTLIKTKNILLERQSTFWLSPPDPIAETGLENKNVLLEAMFIKMNGAVD